MPQLGQASWLRSTSSGFSIPFFSAYSSWRWSARNRLWQDWHSVSGSVKVVDVAGGLPGLARQDHAGVEADDVLAGLHHRAPPLALDVVLELDAQRAVVPRRPGAAVDLPARVDEAPSLGERDDAVDDVLGVGGGRLGHGESSIAIACPVRWLRAGEVLTLSTAGLLPHPRSRGSDVFSSPSRDSYAEGSSIARPSSWHGTHLHVVPRQRPAIAADVLPAWSPSSRGSGRRRCGRAVRRRTPPARRAPRAPPRGPRGSRRPRPRGRGTCSPPARARP